MGGRPIATGSLHLDDRGAESFDPSSKRPAKLVLLRPADGGIDGVRCIRAERGILALRLFDVAYSIELRQAEALYATHAKARSDRSRLSQVAEKGIAFGDPPVVLRLDPVVLAINGATTVAQVSVRLYDFGAIAITLRIAVVDQSWPDL